MPPSDAVVPPSTRQRATSVAPFQLAYTSAAPCAVRRAATVGTLGGVVDHGYFSTVKDW